MNFTNDEEHETRVETNGNEEWMNERQNLIIKCERLETQVQALKEVALLRKNLLDLREKESRDLIDKLKYFEELVTAEKKYGQDLSKRVAAAELECAGLMEKLGQNGFSLHEMKAEYEAKVEELINKLESSQKECQERWEENEVLKDRIHEDKSLVLKKLEQQFKLVSEKNRVLKYSMSLLNTLFTETDVPLDMDRVRAIGNLVRESHELPNVLNDLEDSCHENCSTRKLSLDFDGIIEKLDASESNTAAEIPGQESCYQKIDSIQGPVQVLSISRTFIKIKDLILEKKSLKKEIDGLKNLNEKLFKKVDRQEKRLYNVTTELNKTWSLVTTLESQQQSFHNSRSALRYDLHEKRKVLDKIKHDLFLSHEKWTKVKQKNSASEIEWNSIQAEFARRRLESASRQSQESAFCEGTSIESTTNSNEGTEITEEEKDSEKRKALEDEIGGTFSDPLDEYVSELVEEIEDIEAAADDEENEDEEDDSEVINEGNINWDGLVNRRALRLRLLEEQCRLLYNKLKDSSARNSDLATKLSNLHDHYGSDNASNHDQNAPGTSRDASTRAFANLANSSGFGSGESTEAEESRQPEETTLSLITHAQSTTSSGQLENETVIVSEPIFSEEFVRLSPQSSSLTATNHSTENSLVVGSTCTTDTIKLNKESVVMPSSSTSISERKADLLSSVERNVREEMTEATSSASTSQNFKIPIAPPLPPINYCESGQESLKSSPDLSMLGRLIIQQLPKRLEILRQENSALIQEASEMKDCMRETQIQLDSQKRMLTLLQGQIDAQSDTDAKLQVKLATQQQIVDRLNGELEVTYSNIDNLEREKENMENFLDLFIKDRTLTKNRPEVKSNTFKNCDSCNFKFSLLKRKYNCMGCGNGVCKNCTTSSVASNSRTQKRARLCSCCSERKQKLDSLSVSSDA